MMAFQQRGRHRLIASLLFSLALLLAACGQTTPTAAPPTATVAAQAAASPTVPPTLAVPTATATAEPTRSSAPSLAATPGTPGVPTPTAVLPTATAVLPTATSVLPTATQVPRAGLPVKLKIPKIKVDANIEYVGLAADGAMDVPKNYDNTAWYQLGPRPGERGNAAIAGHVDSKTGKAVFWDLSKLKPGDEIFVDCEDGVERKFVVKEIASYKRADAPLDRIFGASTHTSLNLITCDPTSTFNRTTNEYAANVVVYTELADGQ